jgi:hypothetical protein
MELSVGNKEGHEKSKVKIDSLPIGIRKEGVPNNL